MSTFFTADTHFGHAKATGYYQPNGSKLRPWAEVEQHDRALIENWNSVVDIHDTVYHIGDVYDTTIIRLPNWMESLNGKKILVKGNLDIAPTEEYLQYFEEVYDELHTIAIGETVALLTHNYMPIDFIKEHGCSLNIHGHLHADSVPNAHYFCVSLERTNFAPIRDIELLNQLKENQLIYSKII